MTYSPSVKTLTRENDHLRAKVERLEKSISALRRENINLRRTVEKKGRARENRTALRNP
jgi:predicted RNase H-like nuclease (RuvC/YqgF family)